MKITQLTVTVRFRWWLRIYLCGVALTGLEPNVERQQMG